MNDVLDAEDYHNLRHMLGASEGKPKNKWGFRNYFAAGIGRQTEQMEKLLNLGFVEKGTTKGDITMYFATESGCKKIGFNKAAITRALEK